MMTQRDDPITVTLSAPGQEQLNNLYRAFMAESGRVSVSGLAPNMSNLRNAVKQQSAEVVIVDAELFAHEGEQGLTKYLQSALGSSIAVVLIPSGMSSVRGRLMQIDRVHEVLVKPVNPSHLINRCYQVGTSQRATQQSSAPATAYARDALAQTTGAARATALSGTRVIAVGGGKGGPGKTTVATNLAYRLNQVGIRTLCMGFDTPDAVGVQLGLPMTPNSSRWFQRQSRQNFDQGIQEKDGLDVLLSPNDKSQVDRIARRGPDEQGSIARLVEAARDHNPPYAAIVMDLPPTEQEWAVQPLLRANTVLLVCEPDWASQVHMIETIRLLTGKIGDRYQIPREAIHGVLNRVNDQDALTPNRIQAAMRDKLNGWAPPFIATIPADPGVRAAQTDFVLPVARRDEFSSGIDQIVDFFYHEALGTTASEAVGGQSNGFLGISLQVKE